MIIRTLFVCLLLSWLPCLTAASTALRFGKLVNGNGQVVPDAVVVVDGNRILSVSTGNTSIPANSKIIDLRRFTAVPGLIDVHTHMTFYWDGKSGTTPYRQPRLLPPETVFLAQENARKTLESGVTTVRDLNAADMMDIAMRNLINRGAMVGPRMFVSSYGLGTKPGWVAPGVPRIDGPAEMMRSVRDVRGHGADWVKLFASTGGTQDLTGYQIFTREEMKAAVEVAHNLGKRVAVHSYGAPAGKDAVLAGVDTLEHAIDLDDETLKAMVRQGTYYVPTIEHNMFYAQNATLFGFPAGSPAKFQDYHQRNLETTKRALQAGVKIAMGSDAVYTMFGQNTIELKGLVDAGMTQAQALEAATVTGASLLGMNDKLGLIAPGYYADITAVEGDPLTDINALIGRVRWVMKGGAVVVDKTKQENVGGPDGQTKTN